MALEHLVAAVREGLTALEGQRPVDGFLVQPLRGAPGYLVGYDAQGRTALVAPQEQLGWPPLILANLQFLPSLRSRLTDAAGTAIEEDVAVVLVDAAGQAFEPMLPSLLAGVVAAAGITPQPGALGRAVRGLRDVFQALSRDAARSYLGTWGELFVMAVARDSHLLASGWGADASQTFDFAVQGERLEVKTTLQATRRHHFSYSQLLASRTTTVCVASIQTAVSADGATAQDLLVELLAKLSAQPHVAAAVLQRASDALGSELLRVDVPRYDRELASDSLAVFAFDEIPTVALDVGVLDVHWTAQLPVAPATVVRSRLVTGLGRSKSA